ncbi:hypothetical protein KCU85_g78, partial [Aureobasidium melanogenum]
MIVHIVSSSIRIRTILGWFHCLSPLCGWQFKYQRVIRVYAADILMSRLGWFRTTDVKSLHLTSVFGTRRLRGNDLDRECRLEGKSIVSIEHAIRRETSTHGFLSRIYTGDGVVRTSRTLGLLVSRVAVDSIASGLMVMLTGMGRIEQVEGRQKPSVIRSDKR